jgi:hypothetical protein
MCEERERERERESEREMDDTWMRERNTWMILGCKREREREGAKQSQKPEIVSLVMDDTWMRRR